MSAEHLRALAVVLELARDPAAAHPVEDLGDALGGLGEHRLDGDACSAVRTRRLDNGGLVPRLEGRRACGEVRVLVQLREPVREQDLGDLCVVWKLAVHLLHSGDRVRAQPFNDNDSLCSR